LTTAGNKPRRKRVPGKGNTGIYERSDGQLEIAFSTTDGAKRCAGVWKAVWKEFSEASRRMPSSRRRPKYRICRSFATSRE
jgi:hypothetical protein